MSKQTLPRQPVELVKVEFYDQEVEAVWDGSKAWVVVKRICENLGIAAWRQVQKIRKNPTFEGKHQLALVPSQQGEQRTFCLELKCLALWLASISVNKVKPEAKDRLKRYQLECMEVLTEYFFGKKAQISSAESNLLALSPQEFLNILLENQRQTSEMAAQNNATMQLLAQALGALTEVLKGSLHGQAHAALPAPTVDVPEPTDRAQVNRYMRSVAHSYGLTHQNAFGELYRAYYDRYGVDLRTQASNNRANSILGWAEALSLKEKEPNHVARLYALAHEIFPLPEPGQAQLPGVVQSRTPYDDAR